MLSRTIPGLFEESWNAGKPGCWDAQSGYHWQKLRPAAFELPGFPAFQPSMCICLQLPLNADLVE
jgi:hypothetical protein